MDAVPLEKGILTPEKRFIKAKKQLQAIEGKSPIKKRSGDLRPVFRKHLYTRRSLVHRVRGARDREAHVKANAFCLIGRCIAGARAARSEIARQRSAAPIYVKGTKEPTQTRPDKSGILIQSNVMVVLRPRPYQSNKGFL